MNWDFFWKDTRLELQSLLVTMSPKTLQIISTWQRDICNSIKAGLDIGLSNLLYSKSFHLLAENYVDGYLLEYVFC